MSNTASLKKEYADLEITVPVFFNNAGTRT